MKKIVAIVLGLYLSCNLHAMKNQQDQDIKAKYKFERVCGLLADCGTISHLEWSPLAPKLLACAINANDLHKIHIWDVNEKALLTSLEHEKEITSFAWHAYDETRFATATDDGYIYLWEWDKKVQKKPCVVKTIKAPKKRISCTCIKWGTSKNSKHMLAAAYTDNTIIVWSIGKKISKCILKGHTDGIESLAWNAFGDGDKLASSGRDGNVKLWDTSAGKLLNTVTRYDEKRCIIPNIIWHPNTENDGDIMAFSSHTDKKAESLLHLCNLTKDKMAEISLDFFPDMLYCHPKKVSFILVSGIVQKGLRIIQLLTTENNKGVPETLILDMAPNFGPHIAWNPFILTWDTLAIPEKNGIIGIYKIQEIIS